MRLGSPEEAVVSIGDRHTIFAQGGAATPTALLAALAARAPELADVTTVGLHLEGPCPHLEPSMVGHIRHRRLASKWADRVEVVVPQRVMRTVAFAWVATCSDTLPCSTLPSEPRPRLPRTMTS